MDRLKQTIEKYSRWQPLREYIDRIAGYRETDFSLCVENAKSLLESIAKEICDQQAQPLEGNESVSKLLGLSFRSLGFPADNTVLQIGTAIANIGQQMGNFRNEIGKVSHARTLDELQNRRKTLNTLTEDFLLQSTEIVSCFLIETFELDNPRTKHLGEIIYEDSPNFNESWDETFGEFVMTPDYTYAASEILFNLDREAYKSELQYFKTKKDETGNGK